MKFSLNLDDMSWRSF